VFGKGKYKSVPVSQPAKVEDKEHKNIGPILTANEMIICDTNPYNKRGYFRLLWNSKLDKNNNLEFYKDRLIIQVESIPKLFEHVAPKYDMVILDEIEADCSKILCLDGDFGNRAFDFVKEFNPIIIENIHIGKGNNICVVSMSSKFANMINNLYTAKEAGVNFDVPHVHKMFICLSGMSISIRGLSQMSNRCR